MKLFALLKRESYSEKLAEVFRTSQGYGADSDPLGVCMCVCVCVRVCVCDMT